MFGAQVMITQAGAGLLMALGSPLLGPELDLSACYCFPSGVGSTGRSEWLGLPLPSKKSMTTVLVLEQVA